MALSSGTRLGPYEILSALGAGGMGEVYKAKDTRLDRTVAIKVLPAQLADDPQFHDRFEREAKAIAALTHPHICTLYDVGRQDMTEYLVMEYLEGETLQDRLTKGALPLDQALKTAIEIASALDKAHRAGIVHRDLKPGNIMLTKAGAKLLDFGLAKTSAPVVAGAGFSMLPTTPPNLTAQGTILGTFQYMAPEQLEGQEADARTDLFAFGAVLYEMLTGNRAFEGKSQASLIGAIMHADPPSISALQPLTPAALDRVVRKCLKKDPDDRWQTARDLLDELKWVIEGTPAPALRAVTRRSPRLWQWVNAALLVALLSALTVGALRTRVASPIASPVVFELMPPDAATFITPLSPNGHPRFALSPDGHTLAFVAVSADGRQQLWTRPLAVTTAQLLAGTDGADAPFWSADGRYIGFFALRKLKYVEAGGGTPQTLGDAPVTYGAAWNLENTIVFASTNEGLKTVRLGSSHAAVAVTHVDPKSVVHHGWPDFLPDGRHFLYAAENTALTASDIFVGSLDGGDPTFLLTADAAARYAAPGYLLFPRGGALLAQRFDLDGLRLLGEPARLLDLIGRNLPTGYTALSVSAAGQLAYGQTVANVSRVVWRDRTGRVLGQPGPADTVTLSLSRDGSTLAMARTLPEAGTNIWLSDVTRPTPIRFTFDVGVGPIWSRDGRFIAYGSSRGGGTDQMYRKAADRSSQEELILAETGSIATDWSADGKLIIFHTRTTTSHDVRVLSVPERKSSSVLDTPFNEVQGTLSPDGRWLAYASDKQGRFDVFVLPFPPMGIESLVSSDGGTEPRWRGDGRELFYLSPDRRLMAVPVPTQTTPRFKSGKPEALFDADVRDFVQPFRGRYDVTADGQRFVLLEPPPRRPSPITVVVNWTGVLRSPR